MSNATLTQRVKGTIDKTIMMGANMCGDYIKANGIIYTAMTGDWKKGLSTVAIGFLGDLISERYYMGNSLKERDAYSQGRIDMCNQFYQVAKDYVNRVFSK